MFREMMHGPVPSNQALGEGYQRRVCCRDISISWANAQTEGSRRVENPNVSTRRGREEAEGPRNQVVGDKKRKIEDSMVVIDLVVLT